MTEQTGLILMPAAGWHVWAALAAGLGLLLPVAAAARRTSGWRRAALIGLRLALAGCLLLMLLRPARERERWWPVTPRLPVLIDVSGSMAGPASGPPGRLERLGRQLRAVVPDLERRFLLESWCFAEQLAACPPGSPIRPTDGRERTDISGALRQAVAGPEGGVPPPALLLLTDGRETAGDRVPYAGPVPVYVVAAPPDGPGRDVSVSGLSLPAYAFLRGPAQVGATVRFDPGLTDPVALDLLVDGRTVASRTVEPPPGGGAREVVFDWRPERLGRRLVSVMLPPLPGEAETRNNAADGTVAVVRDRVRLLHLAGRPDWDVRFVRGALAALPAADLVSFFILRTAGDLATVPERELSLIPFPTRELFEEKLSGFDITVFQNFSPTGYGVEPYLGSVRDFVDNGGGLLMIGGENSFLPGNYAGSPLAGVLPVSMEADGGEGWSALPFRPRIADGGRDHPLLAHRDVGRRLERELPGLPLLDGLNTGLSPLPASRVLLEGETDGRPVLVIRSSGRGRSAALAVDSLWRWKFRDVPAGGDRTLYDDLLGNLLLWLAGDEELQEDRLAAAELVVRPGSEFPVTKTGGRPATGLAVEGPDGRTEAGEGVIRLGREGFHRISAPGSEPLVVAARDDPAELVDVSLDEPFLIRLAEGSGGRFYRFDDLERAVAELPSDARELAGRETTLLIHTHWLIMVVAGIMLAELTLRRRFGLS